MSMSPGNIQELSDHLAKANASGEPVGSLDLGALNQVRSYSPEDMTVTVEAGLSLSDLQALLVRNGQWLPLDPPNVDHWTLGHLINQNPSGPRRNGNGVLRDYVIGLEAVRADGQIIKSGGQVVKNVAGFDLCKLFIGAGGSLGVVTSMTFKLVPLPEKERMFSLEVSSLEALRDCLTGLRTLHQEVIPAVFDFFREEPEGDSEEGRFGKLIIGYAGKREAVDQWCGDLVQSGRPWREDYSYERRPDAMLPSALDHEQTFWAGRSWLEATRESMLPSRLPEWIAGMPPEHAFLVRMGQGSAYYCGSRQNVAKNRVTVLEERMKRTFDPNGILPPLP
jgi:FAD/FMN-containing dehydrogenase